MTCDKANELMSHYEKSELDHDKVVAVIEHSKRFLALYALSLVNLKDNEMNTLILRFMRGMTQKEAAEYLDRAENTIQNWEKAALKKCSKAWTGLEFIYQMLKEDE